ncbi:MAG: sulfotransferase [Sterolibacterium sp.]|jgi:tetratricopeptide (TPR) repeat protein
MTDQEVLQNQQELDSLLRAGRHAEATAICTRLTVQHPASAAVHGMISRVYQHLGNFGGMLEAARRTAALQPREIGASLRVVESLIYSGQIAAALERLAVLEGMVANDAPLLQDVAQMYLHCAGHAAAGRCYERAVHLRPGHAPFLYNLASSCVTLGDIERAEVLFNQVIALDPADVGAYLNRSMLKTWKLGNHHIDELTRALSRLPAGHAGEVALCYALAKEYEDIGEAAESFALLQRGAARRRSMLAYQVENDVAAMALIGRTFDAALLAQAPVVQAEESAMFVLGLPRSGTTLVDRILSSHSQVASLGEVTNFAFALMHLAAGPGGKSELIQRSAQIDFARLGNIYRDGIAGYGLSQPRLINKTPDNFLYLALIRLALPAAKIIHLRRHPLDSCYAMYKTLFRMGYPFSYSLEDLGHYYLAYHRLMQHWREAMPGGFIDIDYETLVDQQEPTSRAMLAYCGLPWEQACLNFHDNIAPAASASAAQVRRPVYRSSVQRWRQYAAQLAPLAEFLTDRGIDCS